MKKLFLFMGSLLSVFLLSSCGYDGHFRYPCQDPVNWETEDCKAPLCVVNGACPEDLVDLDQLQNRSSEVMIDEEITQDGEIVDE